MARRLAAWSIALLWCASTGCPAAAQDSRPQAVATIDGVPVTPEDFVRSLVAGNWSTAAQTLTLEALLDLELKKTNITLSNEEVLAEQDEIIRRIAPGKTSAEVKELGIFSEAEIGRQAWLSRGWDRVFLAEQKLKPEQLGGQTNIILKQLFIRQTMERYEIRKRGDDPGPPPGVVVEIKAKDGGAATRRTDEDATALVLGLIKPGSLPEAVSELVDSRLVDRALARSGHDVTPSEVEAWARSMSEKYSPPFDWRMVCQFKQTTPDQERERWRRIQAWKRATGWRMNEEDLEAFFSANQAHFAGAHLTVGHLTVSHIFVRTRDPVTDRELSPEEAAAARKKIDDLWQKLEEGADFGELAERYSEDPTTAKQKGRLGLHIKKLGQGIDPAFRDAAWKLQPGEISRPVKTKLGWHIIRCDEVTPGDRSSKRFEEPSYREWIVDEYETMLMKAWLAKLRSAAEVWLAPASELAKLKKPR